MYKRRMVFFIKVNHWVYLTIAILLSSCKIYSYENICGEYAMEFPNRYFVVRWTILLEDSGNFVLTEPRIGMLGPDTLSGKYTIKDRELILDFGNVNRYLYKPELGDSVTILHFYNKENTKPQASTIDIYGQFLKENFSTNFAENDTIIGVFDSIVCSTFLTDTMVVYPAHIGYEINIYLFQGALPHSAPYWEYPHWRICSRNKLRDPNRLFVRHKRNIYKRK